MHTQSQRTAARGSQYPGDFDGAAGAPFAARVDDEAQPGEVVWAWVPYEEDHAKGKDRPVLVIGSDVPWLLALPMTSIDHDLDEDQERSQGRYWIDVGSGGWDRRRRPSEARLDRVVRIHPHSVRRPGAAVSRAVYEAVLDGMAAIREGRPYDDDPV